MADDLIKNPQTQIQAKVSPFKGKEAGGQNLFTQKASNDLWTLLNVEISTGKTAMNTDIYSELAKMRMQAHQLEAVLSTDAAPSLDLLG